MPDIEIVIRKPQTGDDNLQTEEAQAGGSGEQKPSKKEKGKSSFSQDAIGAALYQMGIAMVQNGINQIGNASGDYAMQRSIQKGVMLAGDIITVGKFGIAGAIMVASKHAISAINSEIDMVNKRREEEMRRQRAGRIIMKGSRY